MPAKKAAKKKAPAKKTSGHFADEGGGWYSIELTRDPRTWLAADVGSLVGSAIFALRTDK